MLYCWPLYMDCLDWAIRLRETFARFNCWQNKVVGFFLKWRDNWTLKWWRKHRGWKRQCSRIDPARAPASWRASQIHSVASRYHKERATTHLTIDSAGGSVADRRFCLGSQLALLEPSQQIQCGHIQPKHAFSRVSLDPSSGILLWDFDRQE